MVSDMGLPPYIDRDQALNHHDFPSLFRSAPPPSHNLEHSSLIHFVKSGLYLYFKKKILKDFKSFM